MAQEVANAFDNMFGDVMRYGVELSNTNKITGISTKLMQEMKYKADQLGVSYDSWLGSLKSIQKANADIMMGQGNYAGFQKLGISMNTIRNPAELLAEVMDRVSSLEPAFRRAIMAEVGIAEEAYLLYTEKAKALRGSLLLSEKDISNQKELNKEWTYLTQTIGASWNRILLDNNEELRKAVSYVTGLVEKAIDFKEESGGWGKSIISGMNELKNWFDNMAKDNIIFRFFDLVGGGLKAGFDLGSEMIGQALVFGQEGLLKPWIRSLSMENLQDPNFNPWGEMAAAFNQTAGIRNVTISDNSQTIINTSDGAGQYTAIQDEKSRSLKSQLGTVELTYLY